MNKKINGIVLALTLLTGLGGCSSAPKIQEFASTASSTDELHRLSTDMSSAQEKQVDVLSPTAYRKAEKALKAAALAQKNGDDSKDILHEIAIGRAHLDRANKSAEVSRVNLEAVVSARLAAITAGAPKLYAEEFNNADEHLRNVTSEIEDNDLGAVAGSRAKLQKEYLDVELKAIKQVYLGPARANLALSVKEGADEFAKQSLAIAERSMIDTEAFIVANRHQTDAIKLRAEASTKAADHLLKITRASKAGQNVSSEQAALMLESEQNKALDNKAQLSVERKTAQGLAVEMGDLKSADAFNKSFEAARHEFTNNEAEVYRQGNRLVIRLRSLEFPSNQSVLRGSNFPVLAKVAKAVKGFEDSSVVIEGHTDADGSKESNLKLSKERAQAISDYLVSNDAISEKNISVTGYGYDRPLATNKTVKGKAQNRRVDVVISPRT